MNVTFEKKFQKDIQGVTNAAILQNIEQVIINVKQAKTLKDIPNIKKLKGAKTAYRIRIGDYRIGIYIENGIVEFVCLLPRSIIYRYFPK